MTDKERLDAQDRAIQLIALYLDNADPGFKVHVQEHVQRWSDTADMNQTTSDANKAASRQLHSEVMRLLRPGKSDVA